MFRWWVNKWITVFNLTLRGRWQVVQCDKGKLFHNNRTLKQTKKAHLIFFTNVAVLYFIVPVITWYMHKYAQTKPLIWTHTLNTIRSTINSSSVKQCIRTNSTIPTGNNALHITHRHTVYIDDFKFWVQPIRDQLKHKTTILVWGANVFLNLFWYFRHICNLQRNQYRPIVTVQTMFKDKHIKRWNCTLIRGV